VGALTMERLRSAVVGCGRMGAFTSDFVKRIVPGFWLPLSHADAIAAHPQLALAALCDVDAQRLALAQQRFGVARGYTDFRELIEQAQPEVLGIATRTPERPALIEYAVQHGVRAMHIEKPLCSSVQQLTDLERLLAPSALVCTYGTLRRYMNVYARAKALAHSGRFGELQQIQANFGAATLLWTHPHSLDLLLYMAGDAEVELVSARFADAGLRVEGATLDGDPSVLGVLVEFSNGVTGVIGTGGGMDLVLSCRTGSISVEADGHRIVCRHARDDEFYWHVSSEDADWIPESGDGLSGGTRLAFDRLVRALSGAEAARADADKRAILAGQRLLFACAQSHLAGGAAINPRKLDPELLITGRSGDRHA
jgi:scyllo-inositol 2-dehydrogenase (NAD+)